MCQLQPRSYGNRSGGAITLAGAGHIPPKIWVVNII